MAYTVKELAEISGVSIRTLHFYDEIGLLKPAYVGDNNYRYYQEKQVLLLQQILFFREIGFELKKIKSILEQSDFDKVTALKTHRKTLQNESDRFRQLVETVDKTIGRLTKGEKMKDKEIFIGFSTEKQNEYQEYLENRFGIDHPALLESRENIKKWSKNDWEKLGQEWDAICKKFAEMMKNKLTADSPEAQKITLRHYQWLKNFWTPNKESYSSMGQGYTGFEWKKTFEPYDSKHPRLAQFMANAIKIFAENKLVK